MRKARLIAIGLATLGALAGAQPAFADCRSDSIACNANGAGAWCAQKKGNSASATQSYSTRSCKTDYRKATGRIWNSSLQRFVPTWGSICETTCPPGPAGQNQGTPKTIQQLRNIRQF